MHRLLSLIYMVITLAISFNAYASQNIETIKIFFDDLPKTSKKDTTKQARRALPTGYIKGFSNPTILFSGVRNSLRVYKNDKLYWKKDVFSQKYWFEPFVFQSFWVELGTVDDSTKIEVEVRNDNGVAKIKHPIIISSSYQIIKDTLKDYLGNTLLTFTLAVTSILTLMAWLFNTAAKDFLSIFLLSTCQCIYSYMRHPIKDIFYPMPELYTWLEQISLYFLPPLFVLALYYNIKKSLTEKILIGINVSFIIGSIISSIVFPIHISSALTIFEYLQLACVPLYVIVLVPVFKSDTFETKIVGGLVVVTILFSMLEILGNIFHFKVPHSLFSYGVTGLIISFSLLPISKYFHYFNQIKENKRATSQLLASTIAVCTQKSPFHCLQSFFSGLRDILEIENKMKTTTWLIPSNPHEASKRINIRFYKNRTGRFKQTEVLEHPELKNKGRFHIEANQESIRIESSLPEAYYSLVIIILLNGEDIEVDRSLESIIETLTHSFTITLSHIEIDKREKLLLKDYVAMSAGISDKLNSPLTSIKNILESIKFESSDELQVRRFDKKMHMAQEALGSICTLSKELEVLRDKTSDVETTELLTQRQKRKRRA